MIMANDTNLGCFDFYAAYKQRNWANVEHPATGHSRVRLMSRLLRMGK